MGEAGGPRQAVLALAVALIVAALLVTGAVLYIFQSARRVPGEIADSGRKALSDLREVAAAFRTGSITTTFRSDATAVTGATRLQFVELRQEETFERRDAAAVLWGVLALPDVVVEARAPVTYTYYLDLDKEWRFRLERGIVDVIAPAVEWNRPAADVSALRFSVREGSVLRDEQIVLDRLRAALTPLLEMRAREHVPLARETGRRRVEAFVETWLVERFADGKQYRARVVFGSEQPPASPRRLALPSPQS
jgi:hypothetical protein